ncbi:MAG: carboxypeptidase-like regulatory domain-containing protein [Desulfomonilaceae bacterium]
MPGWRHQIESPNVYRFLLILLTACSVLPDLCQAAPTIPGEGRHGLFYVVTHLHPVAYVILFLVAVLSIINLFVQGWLPLKTLHSLSFMALPHRLRRKAEQGPAGQGMKRVGIHSSGTNKQAKPTKALGRPPSGKPADEGIVNLRRVVRSTGGRAAAKVPTPLEGINHPLPQFSRTAEPQTGNPRVLEREQDQKRSGTEFKFSSAVDLVPQEEMGRREKEQLVVSGTVTGPDGHGIASVMVYLVDEAGSRVGQSSRSARDTGEFKVLAHEPGKYALNGYKRGFVAESREPLILPIESGKIEGFNLRMIPEGCLVHGRVLLEGSREGAPDFEVRCFCEDGAFARSDRSDSAGEFGISGVPLTSKCSIEVCGTGGEVLAKSAPFETLHKKEVYREIAIAPFPTSRSTSTATIDLADVQEDNTGEQGETTQLPLHGQ